MKFNGNIVVRKTWKESNFTDKLNFSSSRSPGFNCYAFCEVVSWMSAFRLSASSESCENILYS
ncbi:hypothetical protein MA16_Dca024058 [Dendrobium catenatum]|uniref:Uncharacterized protein n=1 Tax=Dendrobium catenatum TaxID=906689 RepID=A0A2I0VCL4_9ASPA|nr:hypothetical protein MA16_Dca024058 [Dendrobium catenatum]